MGAIFCATGHRPQGIPKYSYPRLIALCEAFLKKYKPSALITGGCIGFDQAMAEACMRSGVPYDVYIPFVGQEEKWGKVDTARYRTICSAARNLYMCSDGGYSKQKYAIRDRKMVDDGEQVVALLSGLPSGTKITVDYAVKCGKPVMNLWDSWLKYA
jgi:uncharacterized phage-like protein YoqJ